VTLVAGVTNQGIGRAIGNPIPWTDDCIYPRLPFLDESSSPFVTWFQTNTCQ